MDKLERIFPYKYQRDFLKSERVSFFAIGFISAIAIVALLVIII